VLRCWECVAADLKNAKLDQREGEVMLGDYLIVCERGRRMIEESSEPKATDRITVLEGFGAMRIFLEAIWRRQGKSSEEIAFVLAGSQWMDGSPADPTIWDEWIAAVRVSSSGQAEHKAIKPD
jgi:hypothetical protein